VLDELVERAPARFRRYLEPFVGGGALFFRWGAQGGRGSQMPVKIRSTAAISSSRRVDSEATGALNIDTGTAAIS
jgi:hypothetical protein